MSIRRRALLFTVLLTMTSPLLMGMEGLQGDFESRLLDSQNLEREALGLPPLKWNASLAESALAWANALAASGRFEHAHDGLGDPQGENLWAGTRGYYSPEAMVSAWSREKRFFKPGVFPDSSTTGDVEDVGHYTQMVWRDTGEVGCAKATSAQEDILVCRYSNAGNYVGEIPF